MTTHEGLGLGSICVHAGTTADPRTGAVMTPIYQTSTYVQQEPGEHRGWDYSRAGNPSRDAYEEALAKIEGGALGLAFSSGLAAIQAVIQALVEPGDRVLVCDDVYGGTGRLFRTLFAKYNITFDFVNLSSELGTPELESSRPAKLIWVETPSNPTMKLVDLAAAAKLAKKWGSLLAVDNTFASPIFQRPFEFGADIVMHSTTKYIGGHSDMIGGALISSSKEIGEKLRYVQFAAGSVPSPFESFLMHRSLKTLSLRMHKHESNAMGVAEFLKNHPRIEQVFYPGLPSDPYHKLAKQQMRGFSGMLSFKLKGSYEDVKKFLKKLEIFVLAESLGGVESLVNHPEKMTHASVPPALRDKLGIGPNLLRLSAGVEDLSDLIADLKQALKD